MKSNERFNPIIINTLYKCTFTSFRYNIKSMPEVFPACFLKDNLSKISIFLTYKKNDDFYI
jgi:hypothetical protein